MSEIERRCPTCGQLKPEYKAILDAELRKIRAGYGTSGRSDKACPMPDYTIVPLTHDEFFALSPQMQNEFARNGGKLIP